MKNADDVKTWLCFFEQSGTAKSVLRYRHVTHGGSFVRSSLIVERSYNLYVN